MGDDRDRTEDQGRFFELLDKYPRIAALWSKNNRGLDPNSFNEALDSMPGADQVMALFFVSLWQNRSHPELDLIAAMRSLDEDRCEVIKSWFDDPFWP